MGIQGLLPFLKKSTRNVHVSEFQNEVVAIDAYCWLHKGIYSCAYELATNQPTTKYVNYCMRYIEMLLHFEIKPILVFDGRQLFSKKETEEKRREERKKKKERGKELMRAGKVIEGKKLLGESVNITHEFALNVMKKCREKNIDCIVAPYEADAQLAFLSLNNIVKCVITEDSDLLAYGCERVMFKMDTNGNGELIEISKIPGSLNMSPAEFNSDIFRYMCILSGCDYLPSIPSIGPAYALKFVKKLKDNNIFDALPKLPIYVDKLNIIVPPEYIEGFRIANNTFRHQLVYDSFRRCQVPLNPVINDDDIVGTKLTEDLAFQLAVGNIDPDTLEKVDDFDPDRSETGFNILWKTDLLPRPVIYNFSETKKRQREDSGSDSVQSVTNYLKKQRTPVISMRLKNLHVEKTAANVPKNGFIFDLKNSVEKKTIPQLADESKLLKSRYFSIKKEKKLIIPQVKGASDKRKDETYEDYLLRLYNEYFPNGENNDKDLEAKEKDCSCHSLAEKKLVGHLCSVCQMCSKCCCCGDSVKGSESQVLNGCVKRIEEVKKIKRKPPQHFLLDEIHKNQTEIPKNHGNEEKRKEIVEQASSIQSLSFNFKKMWSRLDSIEAAESQTRLEEKNDEIIFDSQEPVRSSSPVFKVQKEVRSLSKNFEFRNVLDTAGTSTSIYFSPNSSTVVNEGNPEQVLPTSTQFSNDENKPSAKISKNKPNKKGKIESKTSSLDGTLFQYGFKKQCKTDNSSKESNHIN